MDVKSFSDQLLIKMNHQIEVVRKEGCDELSATAKISKIIRNGLTELKRFVHQYRFNDQEEEIYFFKEVKPLFLSRYFYHKKLLSILIKTSLLDGKEKIKHYGKMLKRIQEFLKENNDIYRYWLTGSVHWDDKYFLRNEGLQEDPAIDDKFSVGYDHKIAQLLANGELAKLLLGRIEEINAGNGQVPELKWTGSKTALVELIYALQTVGVFNNASADVKKIATYFEQVFNINLGNFYDTFQQIRIRKVNTYKFLEELKERFSSRIEKLDEN